MEIWKDIKGYEGIYQISNLGNVRSLDYRILNTNGVGYRTIKGRVMKPRENNKGYLIIGFSHGKRKTCTVHRLVAQAFIPNPNNYSDVNHIDENKHNNNVENLEWISHKDNMNYGNRSIKASLKLSSTRQLAENGRATKIINLDTMEVFDTIKEAAIKYSVDYNAISRCCRGKVKTSCGYRWKYYDDYLNMKTLGEVTV